jgi:hypothetical protein
MRSAYTALAYVVVTNRRHDHSGHDNGTRERGQQGAGSPFTGACRARVKIGNRLSIVCALLLSAAPAELLASTASSSPAKTSFAYSKSHTVKPLPDSVIEKITEPHGDSLDSDDFEFTEKRPKPLDVRVGPPRNPSRNLVCSAAASVAQANNLPVPFFANLIWQESSFDTRTISRAGAQGIAQFMPRTAVQFGLINPFEPIHALNVAGKFVRDLNKQFGNLGLAAAAYNAGPRRVNDWLAKKGEMPGETRNYVIRVTGRPIEEWVGAKNDVEMLLMPAKAPCVEVAEAVEAQVKAVRMSRLIAELAATASQTRDKKDAVKPDEPVVADVVDRGWRSRATVMVRDVLKRLEEQRVAARIAARNEAKAAAKAAVAARNAAQQDRASGTPMRKAEVKTFTPPADRTPPASAEKDSQRTAVRVVSTAEIRDSSRPDAKGTPKTDGAKTETAKAGTRTDGSKPDTDKLDPATAEDAKAENKEAAKEPSKPRRRIERIARFLYSDSLNRPF